VGTEVRGLMAVPLLTREREIGVVEVSSSEPGAYTNSELQTLQAVASALSMALENASLYDELKTLLREREQAQAQLIHAEKMAALGRLSASIAHEINNPLQAMQTYLTLAQEELGSDQRPEEMNRYLGTVGNEIERIAAIVRRMRDFYRPAREELQPTYLHAVLESVLELTSKQLQHSNVTVQRTWTDYLPEIQANPDHLKQVFLNLVLNSIDAMRAGGVLRISTAMDRMLVSNNQQPLPAVRIEFSDTGEGIPPEVLPRLFEPFFTTKERGSGLGLSVSYGIIQAHNGQIKVESHTGLGTTFTILLPVEQPLND
jgi:two-component system NtrC family sensor kinase